jgi:hypothetical protein
MDESKEKLRGHPRLGMALIAVRGVGVLYRWVAVQAKGGTPQI